MSSAPAEMTDNNPTARARIRQLCVGIFIHSLHSQARGLAVRSGDSQSDTLGDRHCRARVAGCCSSREVPGRVGTQRIARGRIGTFDAELLSLTHRTTEVLV